VLSFDIWFVLTVVGLVYVSLMLRYICIYLGIYLVAIFILVPFSFLYSSFLITLIFSLYI